MLCPILKAFEKVCQSKTSGDLCPFTPKNGMMPERENTTGMKSFAFTLMTPLTETFLRPGTPYIIFACLYEDHFSGNWKLYDDGPEVNDNLLMLTGGIKPLERYCDLILKPEEEGGEGFSSIKTYPPSLPSRAKPEIPAKGRLLRAYERQ